MQLRGGLSSYLLLGVPSQFLRRETPIATAFPSSTSTALLALFYEPLIPKSRKLPDGLWTRIFAVSETIKQFKFPAINQSLNFDVSLIMINEEFMDAERVHMRILIHDHTELRWSHKAQTQNLVPDLDTITSLTCTPEMGSPPFPPVLWGCRVSTLGLIPFPGSPRSCSTGSTELCVMSQGCDSSPASQRNANCKAGN